MKTNIVILLFTLLLSCTGNKNSPEKPDGEADATIVKLSDGQVRSLGVSTGVIKTTSVSSTLRVSGKIDVPPQNMVSVSIPLGGYLKTTHLLPGMKVRSGEVIATIEDQQYIQLQQDYLVTRARFTLSESEYRRQRELNASKASSDKTLQQSEADYLTCKAQLKAISEKLRLINVDPEKLTDGNISRSINVYAPIDGFVSKINVNIGKYVNPADVVFELVNPTDIHLALTVFEKDIDKLYIGQRLKAYTNNRPDVKHDCEILLIGRNLSAERSIEVHCHFKDYDNTLIPGMYMNAELDVVTREAQVLPEDAVVSFGNKTYIFIEKERNLFVLTPVTTGISESGATEITGLPAAEKQKIVTSGAYPLLMALKNRQDE